MNQHTTTSRIDQYEATLRATTRASNRPIMPKIGPALTQLAEAIQAAKRAGMSCAELSTHMAMMWPAVPVEDRDDGAV